MPQDTPQSHPDGAAHRCVCRLPPQRRRVVVGAAPVQAALVAPVQAALMLVVPVQAALTPLPVLALVPLPAPA